MPKYISLVDVAGRGMKNAICTLVRENYISNMADKTNRVLFIILSKILSDFYNLYGGRGGVNVS